MQYGTEDASYIAAGGAEGVAQLVCRFYDLMSTQQKFKELRDMHKKDLTDSRDKLTTFLVGWLGGPRLYRDKYGPISIPQAHQHLNVTRKTVEQWLACMQLAIGEQNYDESFANYLIQQLRVPAERILMVVEAKKSLKPQN